ncbi:MAG: helix-turn-helix transcriptional regulator [Clostridiales bacterium]|nr:helix-turn-helix transcriptional regulator [Clostridiales bacterium]
MLGKDFKYIRFKKFMTQEYVAEMIGISRFALSWYEQERSEMPITTVLRLIRLYNISNSEFEEYIQKWKNADKSKE